MRANCFSPCPSIFAVPEHKTTLPGGTRETQSDVLALVRHQSGLAVYAIEGKVDEPLGPTVEEWSINASAGKIERLEYLADCWGWTIVRQTSATNCFTAPLPR